MCVSIYLHTFLDGFDFFSFALSLDGIEIPLFGHLGEGPPVGKKIRSPVGLDYDYIEKRNNLQHGFNIGLAI